MVEMRRVICFGVRLHRPRSVFRCGSGWPLRLDASPRTTRCGETRDKAQRNGRSFHRGPVIVAEVPFAGQSLLSLPLSLGKELRQRPGWGYFSRALHLIFRGKQCSRGHFPVTPPLLPPRSSGSWFSDSLRLRGYKRDALFPAGAVDWPSMQSVGGIPLPIVKRFGSASSNLPTGRQSHARCGAGSGSMPHERHG